MNSMNETRGQNRMAQKCEYERPIVTTFGSVAKLTMGKSGAGADGNHRHNEGNGNG